MSLTGRVIFALGHGIGQSHHGRKLELAVSHEETGGNNSRGGKRSGSGRQRLKPTLARPSIFLPENRESDRGHRTVTLGEQIEFAIYQYVESVGKGQGRSVDIGTLTGLVTGSQGVDVVDALIRLHDQGSLYLTKYLGNPPQPMSWGAFTQGDHSTFFYQGEFKITVAPKGRLDLERRELLRTSLPPESVTKTRTRNSPESFRTAFAQYHDQGVIGQGGTGIVHKVSDDDGELYALKMLRKEFAAGDRLRRFRNELHFCARIQHPNVVHVVDWSLVEVGDTDLPFFVMPLFPTTLGRMMANGIPPEQVLHWFGKILDGIEEVHRLGACHRDLKPKNILCDPSKDALVVSDFGIAFFAEPLLNTLVETSTGDKLANFDYAAPEQHRPGRVDQKADVWALGLILNQMFTGHIPSGKGHKLIAHMTQDYAHLDNLVDRMIQFSPEQRPDISSVRKAARIKGIPTLETDRNAQRNGLAQMGETGPDTPSPDDDESGFQVSSDEGLRLQVELHRSEQGTVGGLVFNIINDRVTNLKACRILARDARSYDTRKSSFREGYGFTTVNLGTYNEVLAGDAMKSKWLLRICDGHLEVGNTVNEGVLCWPAGDSSDLQSWS
jgi:serine/threonine protein kinase